MAGLATDDTELQADREQLWKNFNVAWLALGRAQKEAMLTGQRSTMLLSRETVKDLIDELVRLVDGIERHGLVDYGMGVWEERIVEGMSSEWRREALEIAALTVTQSSWIAYTSSPRTRSKAALRAELPSAGLVRTTPHRMICGRWTVLWVSYSLAGQTDGN